MVQGTEDAMPPTTSLLHDTGTCLKRPTARSKQMLQRTVGLNKSVPRFAKERSIATSPFRKFKRVDQNAISLPADSTVGVPSLVPRGS